MCSQQLCTRRDALAEAENSCTEVCLVVPDIGKSDFDVFQSALFAQEKDNSVDAFVVIRTAEILGVDFVRRRVQSFAHTGTS